MPVGQGTILLPVQLQLSRNLAYILESLKVDRRSIAREAANTTERIFSVRGPTKSFWAE